jgi:hypothetical protein
MNAIETLRERDADLRSAAVLLDYVSRDALRKVLAFVDAYAASGNAPRLPKKLRALFEEIMRDEK